jgi:nitrate/nitrite transport system substrate-binding protein
MAAVSSFFPLGAMEALAQDKRALEKKDLKIGFIAITCASPCGTPRSRRIRRRRSRSC